MTDRDRAEELGYLSVADPEEGDPSAANSWELINPDTANTAASYDSRKEATDAAEWYERTYGKRLVVVGFDTDGLAVEGDA